MTHVWPYTAMQRDDIVDAQRELNREVKAAVKRIAQPRLDLASLIRSGALKPCPRVCWFHRLFYWFKNLED